MADVARLNAEEAEELKRQHIKHELMDHRYYLSKKSWLSEKIELLDYKLDGNVGSATPGGNLGSRRLTGNWIIQAIQEQDELVAELALINVRIERVEDWLSLLDEDAYTAVYRYVITGNCTGAEECANELGMRNVKALLRLIDRSIAKIAENI